MDELVLGLHLGEGTFSLALSPPWETLRTLRCMSPQDQAPPSAVAYGPYLL